MSPAEVTGLTFPFNQYRLCHLWVMCEQITLLVLCNKPLLSHAVRSHRGPTNTTLALKAGEQTWNQLKLAAQHCAQRLGLQGGGGASWNGRRGVTDARGAGNATEMILESPESGTSGRGQTPLLSPVACFREQGEGSNSEHQILLWWQHCQACAASPHPEDILICSSQSE